MKTKDNKWDQFYIIISLLLQLGRRRRTKEKKRI